MKKILFGPLILILLVLVSGATGCNSQKTTTKVESAGLDVSFVKDAPPTSMVVNQEFPIVSKFLQNNETIFHRRECT